MKTNEVKRFVEQKVEPTFDAIGSISYRCAAVLSDGLYLPCVSVKSRRQRRDLALKRFDQLRDEVESASLLNRRTARDSYHSVVESFVAAGNRVADYEIERLELSKFAIPAMYLKALSHETSMSWTQFVGTMNDGQRFTFGTAFYLEFFNMPPGYEAAQLVSVEPHLKEHETVFRERPFFECFVDRI